MSEPDLVLTITLDAEQGTAMKFRVLAPESYLDNDMNDEAFALLVRNMGRECLADLKAKKDRA